MIALAAFSWIVSGLDCAGHAELAVTYVAPFVVVFMALMPWCPPDDFGNAQACLSRVDGGEWLVPNPEAFEPPSPPLNQAYVFEGVSVDAAGNRSHDPGGCGP